MTTYLDMSDLIDAARSFLGREPEVRDAGLLAAAVARPQSVVYGAETYPTFPEKAAALLISLAESNALVAGNERLAIVACVYFHHLNDRTLTIGPDEGVELVKSISRGDLDDIAKVAAFLEQHSKPIDPTP